MSSNFVCLCWISSLSIYACLIHLWTVFSSRMHWWHRIALWDLALSCIGLVWIYEIYDDIKWYMMTYGFVVICGCRWTRPGSCESLALLERSLASGGEFGLGGLPSDWGTLQVGTSQLHFKQNSVEVWGSLRNLWIYSLNSKSFSVHRFILEKFRVGSLRVLRARLVF